MTTTKLKSETNEMYFLQTSELCAMGETRSGGMRQDDWFVVQRRPMKQLIGFKLLFKKGVSHFCFYAKFNEVEVFLRVKRARITLKARIKQEILNHSLPHRTKNWL